MKLEDTTIAEALAPRTDAVAPSSREWNVDVDKRFLFFIVASFCLLGYAIYAVSIAFVGLGLNTFSQNPWSLTLPDLADKPITEPHWPITTRVVVEQASRGLEASGLQNFDSVKESYGLWFDNEQIGETEKRALVHLLRYRQEWAKPNAYGTVPLHIGQAVLGLLSPEQSRSLARWERGLILKEFVEAVNAAPIDLNGPVHIAPEKVQAMQDVLAANDQAAGLEWDLELVPGLKPVWNQMTRMTTPKFDFQTGQRSTDPEHIRRISNKHKAFCADYLAATGDILSTEEAVAFTAMLYRGTSPDPIYR